jgi:hypothetical protein
MATARARVARRRRGYIRWGSARLLGVIVAERFEAWNGYWKLPTALQHAIGFGQGDHEGRRIEGGWLEAVFF